MTRIIRSCGGITESYLCRSVVLAGILCLALNGAALANKPRPTLYNLNHALWEKREQGPPVQLVQGAPRRAEPGPGVPERAPGSMRYYRYGPNVGSPYAFGYDYSRYAPYQHRSFYSGGLLAGPGPWDARPFGPGVGYGYGGVGYGAGAAGYPGWYGAGTMSPGLWYGLAAGVSDGFQINAAWPNNPYFAAYGYTSYYGPTGMWGVPYVPYSGW